jgi:hypothetical protein
MCVGVSLSQISAMKELLLTREAASKDYQSAWAKQEKLDAEKSQWHSKGRNDKAEKLEPQIALVRTLALCVSVCVCVCVRACVRVCVRATRVLPLRQRAGVTVPLLCSALHRLLSLSSRAESAWTTSRRASSTSSRAAWGALRGSAIRCSSWLSGPRPRCPVMRARV